MGMLQYHSYLPLHSERRKVKGFVPATQASDSTALPRQPVFSCHWLLDPKATLPSGARPLDVGARDWETRAPVYHTSDFLS